MLNQPINDETRFPRSEYYVRFSGTSHFKMDNPDYWDVYHRSDKSRLCKKQGQKNTYFDSSGFLRERKEGDNSYYPHSGGFSSPFKNKSYSKQVKGTEHLKPYDCFVRDQILNYKNAMCKVVINTFEEEHGVCSGARPIVFHENDYPCVMVQMPFPFTVEKSKKPFQQLRMAAFVALLNVYAKKVEIPIEMVIRSSFGHDLPSVSEMGDTFRINIGLIPRKYAELIGLTLYNLCELLNVINFKDNLKFKLAPRFEKEIKEYNLSKLTEKINDPKKPIYQSLRNSNLNFDELYARFQEINKQNNNKPGYGRFKPVSLKDKNIWEVIISDGNSGAGTVLTELFRRQAYVEQFTNLLMDKLEQDYTKLPLEDILAAFINEHLTYASGVATMKEKGIKNDAVKNLRSRQWGKKEWEELVPDKDPKFHYILDLLCESLNIETPKKITGLYAKLEEANKNFIASHCDDKAEDGYGSDSDCEGDLEEYEVHFHGKKLRMNNGMSAILLAYYIAQYYLKKHLKVDHFHANTDFMYYEVPGAIEFSREIEGLNNDKGIGIGIGQQNGILFYDLNYCNAKNRSVQKTLEDILTKTKTSSFKFKVAILDYTSAIIDKIKESLVLCLRHGIKLIFLVNSGLKNDQAGADINPYGEMRIITLNSKLKEWAYNKALDALESSQPVPGTTHQIVRGYKNRGLALAFAQFGNVEYKASLRDMAEAHM